MDVQKALPIDAGCWISGHYGQYGLNRLLTIALDCGWDDAQSEELVATPKSDWTEYDYECVSDLADNAEMWLNEWVAPDGYSFGWFDGEFYLWSDEQWEEE